MAEETEEQYLGHFLISSRKLPGSVSLKGRDSVLEVYADKFVHLPQEKMDTIRGVASTGEKLTICKAIGPGVPGRRTYHGTTKHFMSLFPHYVAVGPRHLDARTKTIAELSFTMSGALDLFYDVGAFGWALKGVKDVRKLMPEWKRKDPRKIVHSEVFYFANCGPIISVHANGIHVQAFNAPTTQFPSPRGISVTNQVRISISFARPVNLQDAIAAAYELLSFCEIVAHNKQCIRDVRVRHRNAKDDEFDIRLYISNAETDYGPRVDFRDHLVSGGLHKQEFETVLKKWMESLPTYRIARRRINEGIRDDTSYSIDRLIGAANAFDLLPGDAASKPKVPVGVLKSLSNLQGQARELPSPYREQVLDNLGRVGAANLRQKIMNRFKMLPRKLRDRFPDMEMVIDHAVRTRNYFVHGTKPKLSV